MRIGIYVDVAKGQLSGIGFHIQQLIYALSRIDHENDYFLYSRTNLFGAKAGYTYCPEQSNFHLRPVRAPQRWPSEFPRVWWNYYSPLIIKTDRIDLFHGPNHFLPATAAERNIVTIHDLAFFKMELYSTGLTTALRYWTKKALQSAIRIIAISENTRKDIEALGLNSKKIRVIYNGHHIVPEEAIQYDRMQELRDVFELPAEYILFVGTLHPRKNVPFLVHSYTALKRETAIPHKLVLAGLKGSATEQIETLVKELGIVSDVIITGYLEDWQLALLYKHADLFVLPTLYEGFSLVALEAMNYGIPVVATDCSSIRESVGEAGTLVRCNDVVAMTAAIHRLLVDESLRKQKLTLGKEQSKKFSWDRCARETLSLYKEVYDFTKLQRKSGLARRNIGRHQTF